MPLRLIPVLDVKSGLAVHAVAGDRAHYGRIRSVLHEGSDPDGLARAYRDRLGLRELYLADLDAIAGARPDEALYRGLRESGLSLWVDAGIRGADSLPLLLDSGVETIVVGLETLRGPSALAAIAARVSPDRLVLSLDLRAGAPVTADAAAWGTREVFAIAEQVVALGIRRLLVLDLARVGTGKGTGTVQLVERLAAVHARIEITAGGGIAGIDDVGRLERAGASFALVGSAFHDGRIDAAALAGL
jgi:phosphoribosylformimino-5-aminoimidazole carboxamide ribotide isomerase